MKLLKISCFLILLSVSFMLFGLFSNIEVYAESESYRVCTDKCSIFLEPNSSLGKENILESKNYGDIVNINSVEISDLNPNSNLKYYEVLNEEKVIGYVLTSTVVKSSNTDLKVNFQSNANIKINSEIFQLVNNEYKIMQYNGDNIILQKDAGIKLLNGYDKKLEYTQIAFEYENEILTGYVKTENIKINGFNYFLLIAIFLIVIIFSTIIPIVVKNWKKKKKLANG